MGSDFLFVDPSRIPPRRTAKEGRPRKMESRNIPDASEDFDFVDEKEDFNFPEFVLNPQEFHIHLASHSPSEFIEEEMDYEEVDPLTEEIFFAPKPRPMPSPPPTFDFDIGEIEEKVLIPKKETKAISATSYIKPKEKDYTSKEAILSELEDIDLTDEKLLKRARGIEIPKRTSHINFADFSNEDSEEIYVNNNQDSQNDISQIRSTEVFSSSADGNLAQDIARAEDDWFQVRLSGEKKFSQIKNQNLQEESSDFIFQDYRKDGLGRKNNGIKTFFVILFSVLIPATVGVFLFSNNNFFKSALSSLNSKFFGSSGFVVVNSQAVNVLTGISDVREEFTRNGLSEADFKEFFDSNSSFSWLNIFKKKTSLQTAKINNLEILDKILKDTDSYSNNEEIFSAREKLEKEKLFLNFWSKFLQEGKQYLIVLLDSEISTPSGGKPVGYAVVKSNGDSLETVVSGRFFVLDAASDLKKIPPKPIQAFSTSWLPSDAGWFFDFSESGETFADFFENSTQLKIDGVLSISKSFLKDFSFNENIIFDIDSANWFYGFIDSIERKPNYKWETYADQIKNGLKSHRVQFYFRDDQLSEYAINSNWLVLARPSLKEDIFGITLQTFSGNGMKIELAESRNSIEKSGSVLANLNVNLKQNESDFSKSYFKIYIPKGSEIKNITGFSEKEIIPSFDYEKNGFSGDFRISQSIDSGNSSWNADVFDESGLMVVGGWVEAKPGERKKLSLEYVLPFSLEKESVYMKYNLKVLKPLQDEDVPFRLNILPKEGVKVLSVDPKGFVSESLGEYQGNLSSDLNIKSNLLVE